MTRRSAVVCCWLIVQAMVLCAQSSDHDDIVLCADNTTVAQCTGDSAPLRHYARLFPGVHANPWQRLPVKRNGEPLAVHLADSPQLSRLRRALANCRTAAGVEAWRLEQQQIAQGGAVDLALQLAVSRYPHLVDSAAAADLVMIKLPLTLTAQLWDLGSFSCDRRFFAELLPPSAAAAAAAVGGSMPWRELVDLIEHAVRALNVPSERLFWPSNYWRMDHAAPGLIGYRNNGNNAADQYPVIADFGMRDWHHKFGQRFVYVPAPPLEMLTRLLGNCPCARAADKPVPFFMIGAGRDHPVRDRLSKVNWRRFPGSVVEVTDYRFIRKAGQTSVDYSLRYAALIARAKFCIITSGVSENVRRVFEAIVAGCVPVFMSEWKERRPFGWLINGTFWDKLSLSVDHYDSLPAIEKALTGIYKMPDTRYQMLLKRLRIAAAEVTWSFGNPESNVVFGRAPFNTLQEIANRFV